MYRIQQDESNFSDAEKIAWRLVFPYMYLPICRRDSDNAEKMTKELETLFSKSELKNAVKRLEKQYVVESENYKQRIRNKLLLMEQKLKVDGCL